MDFTVPHEVEAIGDAIVRIIDREVAAIEAANADLLRSHRALYEEDGRYSDRLLALRRQVRMRSAELGFYNLFAPAELGGDAMGAVAAVELQARINAHVGPSHPLVQTVVLPSPFTNGLSPVLRHLQPEIFAAYREGLTSGDKTMCFGLSEPDAGSDVFSMKTKARRDGDDWVISGTKQWITNAPYADYAMLFAITDEEQFRNRKGGITGFFVETAWPASRFPA